MKLSEKIEQQAKQLRADKEEFDKAAEELKLAIDELKAILKAHREGGAS